MKYCILLLLFILSINSKIACQPMHSLTGRIVDHETKEALSGAIIQIVNHKKTVLANKSGNYFISIPKGKNIIKVTFLGFNPIDDTLNITADTVINFSMTAEIIEVENIIVTARNPENNILRTSTNIVVLSNKEIKQLPSLMGEPDVLRLIQLSPGVQSANEGNAGFYVRGGGSDQNLILLDNAPVYNPSHIMGFFSVFNSDVVRDVTLIKSGMPARYGGRMSSIVDIKTIDPNFNKFEAVGSVGIISSRLAVSIPVIKEKVSVQIAARKSYIDEVFKPLVNSFVKTGSSFYKYSRYSFYDLNGKISVNLSNKDKLSVTGYYGNDYFWLEKNQLDLKNLLTWGNRLITSTYKRTINDNWFLENTAYFTNYKLNFAASQPNIEVGLLSIVEEAGYKLNINKYQNNNITNFGFEYLYHYFIPNKLEANANGLDLDFGLNRNLSSHEISVYNNYEYNINQMLSVNGGLRLSYYMHAGPYSELIKNEVGETKDTNNYNAGDIIKTYSNLEPRITIRYQTSINTAIKAAYTRHVQYTHLASASSVTLPTDVWLPSTKMIKPQKSDHYTAGFYFMAKNKTYTISTEVYYKNLYNQIELLHGIINDLQDKMFEESMAFGSGRSYGLEFQVNKLNGKLTGWLSYTLSRSEKKFDEIEEGRIYPADYDRTHDFNLVFNYALTNKWRLSGTFIYATGKAMTIPEYKYLINANIMAGYTSTNSFRMPAYHRLDLSVTYNFDKTRFFESSLNLSIYNVYSRANPYFIYFEITGNVKEYNLNITPRQVTLFPIIPSISYSIKF